MTIISLVLRASTNLQRIGNVLDARGLNPNISLWKHHIMLFKYKTIRNKRSLDRRLWSCSANPNSNLPCNDPFIAVLSILPTTPILGFLALASFESLFRLYKWFLRTIENERVIIWTLQVIFRDNRKRRKENVRKDGNFHPLDIFYYFTSFIIIWTSIFSAQRTRGSRKKFENDVNKEEIFIADFSKMSYS